MSINIANRLKKIEDAAFGGKADEYKNTCFRFNLKRVGSLVINEALIALMEGRELPPILADRLFAQIPKGTPQNEIDEACRDNASGRYENTKTEQWQVLFRDAIADRRRLVNLNKDRIEGFRQHGWKSFPPDIEDERLIVEWIEAEFGPVVSSPNEINAGEYEHKNQN